MWSESLLHDKNITGFQLALKSLIFVRFSLSFQKNTDLKKNGWHLVSCSSCATPCYSMVQAMSNVVDNQSLNALVADSDSVEEFVSVLFFSLMILFQF